MGTNGSHLEAGQHLADGLHIVPGVVNANRTDEEVSRCRCSRCSKATNGWQTRQSRRGRSTQTEAATDVAVRGLVGLYACVELHARLASVKKGKQRASACSRTVARAQLLQLGGEKSTLLWRRSSAQLSPNYAPPAFSLGDQQFYARRCVALSL